MADKVNIKNLNEAEIIQAGDYLIIETSVGTKILDFKNFTVDTGNTSFASTLSGHTADISSNLSLLQQLSGSVIANTTLVSEVSGLTGLNWRDTWSSGITYKQQDSVEYVNSSFVSKVDSNTNNAPTDSAGTLNSTYWNYLAKAGSITLPLSSASAILSHDGNSLVEVKPESDNEIGYVLTSQGISNTPVWQLGTDGLAGSKVDRVFTGTVGSRWWNQGAGPVILMTDGRLLVGGDDDGFGHLAQGTSHATSITFGLQPMMFDTRTWAYSADKVKNVTQGGRTTFVVSSAGDVYSTGYGEYGEHGHGDTTARYMFTRIKYFKTNTIKIDRVWSQSVTDSTIGTQTSMFLTTAGDVYSCGYNGHGQCGIGNTTSPQTTPIKISSIGVGTADGPITNIYHGGTHGTTYAITTGGKVYGWGYNGHGRLGLGDTTNRTSPTVLTALSGAIKIEVPSNGTYYNDGQSVTYEQTFALLSTGVVYGAGFDPNSYGIFGVGVAGNRTTWTAVSGVSGFTDIAHNCNFWQAMVGLAGTEVYAWGANGNNLAGFAAGDGSGTKLTPMKLSNITGCLSSGPDQDNFDIRGKIAEISFHCAAGSGSYNSSVITLRDDSGNFYSAGHHSTGAGVGNINKNIPAPQLLTTTTTDGFVKWNLPCTPADIKDWGFYNSASVDTNEHYHHNYYILTTVGRLFVWGQGYGVIPMTGPASPNEWQYGGLWREVRF